MQRNPNISKVLRFSWARKLHSLLHFVACDGELPSGPGYLYVEKLSIVYCRINMGDKVFIHFPKCPHVTWSFRSFVDQEKCIHKDVMRLFWSLCPGVISLFIYVRFICPLTNTLLSLAESIIVSIVQQMFLNPFFVLEKLPLFTFVEFVKSSALYSA